MTPSNGPASAPPSPEKIPRALPPPEGGPTPLLTNGPAVPPPLVPPPRKKSGFWLWMSIILVVAVAGGALYYFYFKPKPEAEAADAAAGGKGGHRHGGAGGPMPVVAVAARKGDMPIYENGLGTVTPNNTVTVHTRIDGQLMKVLFTEGQAVHEGDPLAEIDPRPYDAALKQAQGQLVHDQALLDNAKIDLDRYKTLWGQDSIPRQTLDTQSALVDQYKGTLDTDAASVATAELNVAYCHITAPLSGRVGLRLVDAGNMVHASDASGLLVINQTQPITVVFTVAEDDLPPILRQLDAQRKLSAEAWDRAMTKKLADGALLSLDNQIDTSTGTVKVKATFPNGDDALFPNQFVNVRLLVETRKDVVLIPPAAIQRTARKPFVYVVKDDDTVTVREVATGAATADAAEVASGVAAGETVVIDGVDRLREGAKVIPQAPGQAQGKGQGQGQGRDPAAAPADAPK